MAIPSASTLAKSVEIAGLLAGIGQSGNRAEQTIFALQHLGAIQAMQHDLSDSTR